jgi:hypothetical protein
MCRPPMACRQALRMSAQISRARCTDSVRLCPSLSSAAFSSVPLPSRPASNLNSFGSPFDVARNHVVRACRPHRKSPPPLRALDFATFNTAMRECMDLFSRSRGSASSPWFSSRRRAGICQRRAEFELAVPNVSAFVGEMTIDCKVHPISLFNQRMSRRSGSGSPTRTCADTSIHCVNLDHSVIPYHREAP